MLNSHRPPAVLFTLLLATSILIPFTSADTVIRSEPIDLFPSGTFNDASGWDTSTQFGYTADESAHWTEAMVTDGHLSITHDRPTNRDSVTVWSSYSPTWDNSSLGAPDGAYSWSKGPEMEVTDFDVWGYTNYPLLNATLLISFAIPDTLQDDEVRFELDWGGNIHLLHKFAHTPSPVDNMQGNPLQLSLDEVDNWTWSSLSTLQVTVDYVSVGGIDDSEVQLDAVGISFTYQGPWSGLDSAKSVNSTTMEMAPFSNFSIQDGEHNNLVTTTCGLEPVAGGNATWVSESVMLPHDQSWGRLHIYGNASSSMVVQSSEDGVSWTSGVAYNDGMSISGGKYVRVETTIYDGCVSGLRVDFNDPTLYITGYVTGEVGGLSTNFSYLSFAMGSTLLTTTPMVAGSFSLALPVGRHLPDAGNELSIGVGARFQWSSDGSAETVVAVVEDIVLTGGFIVEWDRNPTCERPADIHLIEDGIGSVVPFLNSCADDITSNDNLIVNAYSQDESLVVLTYEEGQLIFSQQSEMSGITPVFVEVLDERGNSWSTVIDVTVSAEDDAPTHAILPLQVLAPVGDVVTLPLAVSDIDTPIQDIVISTDTSWATIDNFGDLVLAPLSPGTFDVVVSISDGTNVVRQQLTVLATSDPDLTIEEVDFDPASLEAGTMVEFEVFVRNDGLAAASMVSVRCYNGQTLIYSANISHIPAGSLASTSCFWQPTDVGSTSLRVYVDATHDILEISETNNEYASTIEILAPAQAEDANDGSLGPSVSTETIWMITGILILGSIIALQLAPGKIRRDRF